MTVAAYRDRTTGRYPITLAEIRASSSMLFGSEEPPEPWVMDEANVDLVYSTEPPAYDPATHSASEGAPEIVDGSLRQTWTLTALPSPSGDMVNAESDRRIALGFAHAGDVFDFDAKSRARITGAATLAGFALGRGAAPGDLRWHGGAEDFAWITRDNRTIPVDARTMFAIGQTAAAWEQAHVFAGRALKDTEGGVPADFADDRHWPAMA